MKLSDEQLLEALKDAGHQEAATALEQKVNAETAAGGGESERHRLPDGAVSGASRIARAYGDQAAAEQAGEEE